MKTKLDSLLRPKNPHKHAVRGHLHQLATLIPILRESGLEPALTLANALYRWREEIAHMWRFDRNNAMTEAFHRRMKLIQRRAYGFRCFQNYRLRVIAQCGQLVNLNPIALRQATV